MDVNLHTKLLKNANSVICVKRLSANSGTKNSYNIEKYFVKTIITKSYYIGAKWTGRLQILLLVIQTLSCEEE